MLKVDSEHFKRIRVHNCVEGLLQFNIIQRFFIRIRGCGFDMVKSSLEINRTIFGIRAIVLWSCLKVAQKDHTLTFLR